VRRGIVLAIGVAGVTLTAKAGAEDHPTARFSYDRSTGAERCPDELSVRAAVSARLGYDPFDQDAPRLVSTVIEKRGGDLVARVAMHDEHGTQTGTRELTSPTNDCAELVSAASLAISIAIDPASVVARHPRAKPPSPTPSDEPPARPPPPSSPEPATAPSPDVRGAPWAPPGMGLDLGAGALAAYGSAPSPSVGFRASIGARWRRVSLSVEGRADLPASATAPGSGRVESSILAAMLIPCTLRGVILLCGVAGAGSLRADSSDVAATRHADTFFAAAGVRFGVEIPLGGALAVVVHTDLLATLTPTTLRLNGQDVWTSPPVSGTLGLGMASHF
jgi:hypothetical protein